MEDEFLPGEWGNGGSDEPESYGVFIDFESHRTNEEHCFKKQIDEMAFAILKRVLSVVSTPDQTRSQSEQVEALLSGEISVQVYYAPPNKERYKKERYKCERDFRRASVEQFWNYFVQFLVDEWTRVNIQTKFSKSAK